MNKFTALTGTVAALAMSFATHAQTFSGNANGSNGYANLEKTLNLTCDIAFNGTVTSGTTVAISSPSISPGDFDCIVTLPYGTWSVATVPGDATKVDVTLGLDEGPSDPCYGTVRASWDNSAKILTITETILPPVNSGGGACTIHHMGITIPNLNLS
jgi:hypothetical protein